jgi:hypothetical protein
MKNNRLALHNKLVELFGNNHVYYQPPENLKMEYPCIRYSKSDITSSHADNIKYINKPSYEIVIIDKHPDNDVIGKILELPLSSYDRHYISDNLNHDIIKLFF